jgi:mannose-6-phosphate isomerase-like protein (cupin superfamily)
LANIWLEKDAAKCPLHPSVRPFGGQEDQMKEAIKQLNLSDEFYTPEGCYITELSNTPDDPDASIAQARVEPGVTTRWHRLTGTLERYCIIKGRGRVEVGKLPPQEVNAGDVVLIPPMCRQRITNIGSEDLVFLSICTPRFSNDVYEDIENNSTSNESDA